MNNPAVCSQCGAPLQPGAVFCLACGHSVQPVNDPPEPTRMGQAPPNWSSAPPPSYYPRQQHYAVKNYLVESILATIFCCVPLGVIAIIFAAQVDGHQRVGNIAAAIDASNKAKLFTILSVIIGLVASCGWIAMLGTPFFL